MCLSVIGCKEVVAEYKEFGFGYLGKIDRNTINCAPIILEKLDNEDDNESVIKKLYVEFLLSIGIKYDEKLNQLISEIYSD